MVITISKSIETIIDSGLVKLNNDNTIQSYYALLDNISTAKLDNILIYLDILNHCQAGLPNLIR